MAGESKKSRKHGRGKRKPSHAVYTATKKWETNKARSIAKQAKRETKKGIRNAVKFLMEHCVIVKDRDIQKFKYPESMKDDTHNAIKKRVNFLLNNGFSFDDTDVIVLG